MSMLWRLVLMTNAKNQSVNHSTLGRVPLGTLSKGELCRTVLSLLQENEQLKASLRKVYQEQKDFVNSVTSHSKESK